MQVVKAGVLYFALVFGVGFVLGTIRTLLVVPRVGTRKAELMEMPIMLAATIVAARWTVLRLATAWFAFSRVGFFFSISSGRRSILFPSCSVCRSDLSALVRFFAIPTA